MKAHVTKDETSVTVTSEFHDGRARMGPDRKWDPKNKVWRMPLVESTGRFIRKHFREDEIDPVLLAIFEEMDSRKKKRETSSFPLWYRFKNKPMDHQIEALNKAWGKPAFALFMEMGTGKTFTAINWSCALIMDAQAQGLLVICPTSIKAVWKNEIQLHSPIDLDVFILEAGGQREFDRWMKTETSKSRVLVVGVESLSQGSAHSIATEFAATVHPAMVVDESSRIKTPNATRTTRCWDIGVLCPNRMILTGTPITQGMQDLFAQYRFLDWTIINQKSFFAFRNRYCLMGGFESRQIVGYVNVDELMEYVAPYTYIVKKEDVLDLPPKVYETIQVEPNPEQARVFQSLNNKYDMRADLGDKELEVETILERMTRYQQVAGGLFPFKEDEESPNKYGTERFPGKNPKMEAMMEMIDDLDHSAKVIIWARFIPEQVWIVEELEKRYGKQSTVYFAGGMNTDERLDAIDMFQNSDTHRFFVSSPTLGGIGLTLTAASYVVYYSNSFSLEDRLQSEDRAHRKGQTKSVTYIDIQMNHKIDKDIELALKSKKSVAQYVEDQIRSQK